MNLSKWNYKMKVNEIIKKGFKMLQLLNKRSSERD